jgi:hypothetical protein
MYPKMPHEHFSTLNISANDKQMLASAFYAISSVEGGWEFLKNYSPPENEGFMFVQNPPPTLKEIDSAISRAYGGHSGASYGWTMRHMESIAKNGWDKWAMNWNPAPKEDKVSLLKKSLDSLEVEKARINKELAELTCDNKLSEIVEMAKTVDNFIASVPPTANLTVFANAIQNDVGMRQQIPDIDNQADALRRFAEGKMSYAEMRSLCG